MFNRFKNEEIVIVNGYGKNDNPKYYNRIGKIICRDSFYKDYNIIFEDGTTDWFDEDCLEKI